MNQDEILELLSPEDAAAVLERLCQDDPDIARRAARIADELLRGAADIDGIAADVQMELDSLDVEDLWDHSGGQRDGYHEPGEEACDMCEEALQPEGEEGVGPDIKHCLSHSGAVDPDVNPSGATG